MRILFLSKSPLDRRYGAAKLLVELAEALEGRGARCTLLDPEALGTDGPGFADASAAYLRTQAPSFDVVEFDYKHLRLGDLEALLHAGAERWQRPVFAARCQLWRGHLLEVPPPPLPGWRAGLGRALRGGWHRRRLVEAVARDVRLASTADLVLVSNEADRQSLVGHGAEPARIAVVTPGFGRASAEALGHAAQHPLHPGPVIAFVGTFDQRKGGGDFPALVDAATARLPGVRFRLLGTAGMVPTAEAVLRCFPRRHRHRLEVVPRYAPDALPDLLAGCAAGVFPSYAEGFGYGVLEMLAAGLPVFAYDRPGPPVMLPPEYLVPAGRPRALAEKLADLLGDPDRLARERIAAREQATPFDWDRTADETLRVYEAAHRRLRLASLVESVPLPNPG
jgi:glycosyltransferase involved in cell wall biosynthesis